MFCDSWVPCHSIFKTTLREYGGLIRPRIIFGKCVSLTVTHLSLHSLVSFHRGICIGIYLNHFWFFFFFSFSPLPAAGTGAIKALASARRAPWLPLFPTASQWETTAQTWAMGRVPPTICHSQVNQLISSAEVTIMILYYPKITLSVFANNNMCLVCRGTPLE